MDWTGAKLNTLCDRRGISPSELAERMNVSRRTVYNWLSGRDPRGSHLLQLCELLEVDPWELYDDMPVGPRQTYIRRLRTAPTSEGSGGKLFKRSGITLVYALLTDPRLDEDSGTDLLNAPVRELAGKARMSTGSVSELLTEMKERGFLVTDGRFKRLVNRKSLLEKWLLGYIDYRFKVKKQCFKAESVRWWDQRSPEQEGFLWGGEPAAAVLTDGFLRPEELTIYTDKPLYDLVVDGNLHQVPSGGNVEFVAPLLKSEGEQGCVHPLLVYADLMSSSDDRNLETARRINDRYLRRIIETA
jgi:lambda repressor-like predicted transcriptional regulator